MQSSALRGGPSGVIELGGRLPVWGSSLGLLLEAGFGGLWTGNGSAKWFDSAVLAAFHQKLGPGLLRVVGGPTIDWVGADVVTDNVRYADEFLTFGATAGAGYLLAFGPGAFLGEVRYRLLTSVVAGTKQLGHGATLALGYALFF